MIAGEGKPGWIKRVGRWAVRWGGRLWPYAAGVAVLLAVVYAVRRGFVEGVIGAGGAILGGFLAAWYQARRTEDFARRLRHEERQDEALFRLEALLAQVTFKLAVFFNAKKDDPQVDPKVYAVSLTQALTDVYNAWWQELASKVFNGSLRDMISRWPIDQRIGKAGDTATPATELLPLYEQIRDEVMEIREEIRKTLQLPTTERRND